MRLKQILIAFDQLANTLLGGFADETLSARAYRMSIGADKKRWKVVMMLIDGLFFWQKDHCKRAFLSEKTRKHLPVDYSLTP